MNCLETGCIKHVYHSHVFEGVSLRDALTEIENCCNGRVVEILKRESNGITETFHVRHHYIPLFSA